jgi:hypothetical protein
VTRGWNPSEIRCWTSHIIKELWLSEPVLSFRAEPKRKPFGWFSSGHYWIPEFPFDELKKKSTWIIFFWRMPNCSCESHLNIKIYHSNVDKQVNWKLISPTTIQNHTEPRKTTSWTTREWTGQTAWMIFHSDPICKYTQISFCKNSLEMLEMWQNKKAHIFSALWKLNAYEHIYFLSWFTMLMREEMWEVSIWLWNH